MKTIITDIITFLKKFWTIIGTWIVEMIVKYKFKNSVMLLVALFLWFGLKGGVYTFFGWAVFHAWIGMNIEAIIVVYKELKEKNDW